MAEADTAEFTSQIVKTPRLNINVWTSGPQDGVPLLLVHGNLTTGGFWKYVAQQLPDDVRVIAPDLRGFGKTERKPIDATRGLGVMVDDLRALLEKLGVTSGINAAGWSMGGGVLQQYQLTYPEDLVSLTLLAPLSPYGFGGTKGANGEPCTSDFAGSGAGGAAPEFVRRLREQDTSTDDPTSSPAVIMQTFFGPGENDEVDPEFLLAQLLMTAVGDDFYPGNGTKSTNWPLVAPGDRGVLNTMSPKYFDASALVGCEPKPPITWIRGTVDQVVSDRSMFDFGTLGELGAVPGWPGADVMPPQPMEAQMRAVLEQYAAHGGTVKEVVLEGVGHGLPLAAPERVASEIAAILVR